MRIAEFETRHRAIVKVGKLAIQTWIVPDDCDNRFRLFFRSDTRARVVVYAWVNDRDTLRKAGAASDPYAMFARMRAQGNPPDDWDAFLKAAQKPEVPQRFEATAGKD